jgi:hypothetical protein
MTVEAATATRRAPLIAVLIGSAISLIGSKLTAIAVPWFVLVTTGSAAKTGATGAVAVLPMVVAGTFGGTFVDRLGYKRAGVLAGITSELTVTLLLLRYHTVGLALWQLLLVFLSALLDAPGGMAHQSLIFDLARLSGTTLERANSAFASSRRLDRALRRRRRHLDRRCLVPGAGANAALVPGAATGRHAASSGESYFARLRRGFAFNRADSLMVTSWIVVAASTFLGSPSSR